VGDEVRGGGVGGGGGGEGEDWGGGGWKTGGVRGGGGKRGGERGGGMGEGCRWARCTEGRELRWGGSKRCLVLRLQPEIFRLKALERFSAGRKED